LLSLYFILNKKRWKTKLTPFLKDQMFALQSYLLFLFKNTRSSLAHYYNQTKNNINLLPYLVGSQYSASQLGLGLPIQTLQQYHRPLLQLRSTAMLESNSTQFTGSVQGMVVLWQRCLPLKLNSLAVINSK
jgi:hypothetical protein